MAKGSTCDLSLTAQWKESELAEVVGGPDETRIVTTIMTAEEILAALAATWPIRFGVGNQLRHGIWWQC